MIADVESDQIPETIVAVGFLILSEYIVFWDEMAGARMDAQCNHGAENQIEQRGFEAEELINQEIEGDLNGGVEDLHVGRRLFVQDQRSECIEKRLQCQPDKLSNRRCE